MLEDVRSLELSVKVTGAEDDYVLEGSSAMPVESAGGVPASRARIKRKN
jgi:hypothetical protein